MFVALRYRIPLVIAYSIPGAVLLAKLLPNFTLSEAVGGLYRRRSGHPSFSRSPGS